ncbi:MAG: shikimate kinase [Rhodothermales bacterium]|nr:shikimate kinase [Rhodothermales bacterium]
MLTGFMGSGKSKLGPILARRSGRPFRDLDATIEESEHASIQEIFSRFGEPHFREVERRELGLLLDSPEPAVISLGGGAFIPDENRTLVAAAGFSVWLDVPTGILASRLSRKAHRPLLLAEDGTMPQGDALREKVERLLEARRPAYGKADLTFEVRGSETPHANARRLHHELAERGLVPA